jgi:hypothetical protein
MHSFILAVNKIMELVNTIVPMKLMSQSNTTTKLLDLTHITPHTCSHNKFDHNKQ